MAHKTRTTCNVLILKSISIIKEVVAIYVSLHFWQSLSNLLFATLNVRQLIHLLKKYDKCLQILKVLQYSTYHQSSISEIVLWECSLNHAREGLVNWTMPHMKLS